MNNLQNSIAKLEAKVEKLEAFLIASQELLNSHFPAEENKYKGNWTAELDQAINGSSVTTELFIEESVLSSRAPLSE